MRSRLRRKPNGKLSPTALIVRSTPAERSTYKKANLHFLAEALSGSRGLTSMAKREPMAMPFLVLNGTPT